MSQKMFLKPAEVPAEAQGARTHGAAGQVCEALGHAVAQDDDAQVAERVLVEELPDELPQHTWVATRLGSEYCNSAPPCTDCHRETGTR